MKLRKETEEILDLSDNVKSTETHKWYEEEDYRFFIAYRARQALDIKEDSQRITRTIKYYENLTSEEVKLIEADKEIKAREKIKYKELK